MANPTIKSVAKDAGVSIATVSRVLNKNGYVSSESESRVMRSIQKLGYYPNSIARSLKFETSLSIGLVLSDISNSFFCVVLRSLEDATISQGFSVITCSTDGLGDRELARIHLLLSKRVDGIVLNTSGFNDDYISTISHDIPMVLCGRKIHNTSFVGDFVDSDNEQGGFMLTQHLIELGHRRIAILNGQSHMSSAQERGKGYMDAMETIGFHITPEHPYYFEADFHRSDSSIAGMQKLLSLPEAPTAIIAMNNELCIGALRYCREKGIRIPEQLSLCSYGQLHNDDLLYVHPSYVTMDPQIIGHRIGKNLLERISCKNKLPNREIRYSPALVPGNGVCPPPAGY